ncbi:hypothetical protein AQUCO_03500248v1 [Aquilegia coerulea]|uniref:BHLH domain-containing protein n=1 Tax=Aquilegia coerulea TaxID=218851 RepID=A0A2G5CWX2_AQUCA|nr:hypothetical protein AQUCO_03500248v1 [Aquilegia coerulea]
MDPPSCDFDPFIKLDKIQQKGNRKSFESSNKIDEGGCNNNNNNNKKIKIMHREVEKQRRQEMAGLYRSLRSLVPHEYLKGKRSTSDHMNEATNYIRHQQIKIKELVKKRDELKRISNSSTCDTEKQSCCSQNFVTVQPRLAGVEVIVDCDLKNRGLALSEILGVLAEEELEVICCATTKVNEHSFYSIQAEVLNPDSVDLSSLQHKLIDLNHLYENHS